MKHELENFSRQQVIDVIDDLLQRPDLLLDAISNEHTNNGAEELLSISEDELDIPYDWNLSRQKMPDFDGFYYVYGFMHHSCGNVTPFHKIVECRITQWVKSDVGEQMTYWRNLLTMPKNLTDF